VHPCDMPHSVHVAPCYLICAFSRGNHGYGARCYILPLGSTPRVGIRGGHERNRTQPDAPVHGSHYMILIDEATEHIEDGFPVFRESPCLNPLFCEQSKGGGR
jgi:hypothetical protein